MHRYFLEAAAKFCPGYVMASLAGVAQKALAGDRVQEEAWHHTGRISENPWPRTQSRTSRLLRIDLAFGRFANRYRLNPSGRHRLDKSNDLVFAHERRQ